MNIFRSLPRRICAIAWATLVCATACSGATGARKGDAGQETGPDVSVAPDVSLTACPATCDDNNPCTDDSCDVTTFQCVHAPKVDNTPCQGKLCATGSVCVSGLCLDGPRKTCPKPSDPCLVAGPCIDATGECSTNPAPNGNPCDDGLKCTYGKQCLGGKCTGTPILCTRGNSCDPATGFCPGGGSQLPSRAGRSTTQAGPRPVVASSSRRTGSSSWPEDTLSNWISVLDPSRRHLQQAATARQATSTSSSPG